MKFKTYFALFFCLATFFFTSCNDELNLVGGTIQPEVDKLKVYSDTFEIKASTIQRDSLYVKTFNGYLGEIYDPLYGSLKSDYLCQFYCQNDFKFAKEAYKGKIDSISLIILYRVQTGDPKTPLKIDVYPINKTLDKAFYNDIEPKDYCDMQNLLGSHTHTKFSADSTPNYFQLRIRLPLELGQKFYDETIQNPSSFKSQEAFNRFFPGVYVTTSYGSGNILHVSQTAIDIHYNYAVKSSTGEDSLLRATDIFSVSKEVIQLNRLQSQDTEEILSKNDTYTFLKTPAPIYTRLVVPTKEIASVVEGRILNSLAFRLHYMPQEDWSNSFAPPPHLLLMPEDSLRSFFENGSIYDGITTYISTDSEQMGPVQTGSGYSSSTRTYYFRNIVNLLHTHLKKASDTDLRLLVVPVYRNSDPIRNNDNSVSHITKSISPYLAPSGVKLRKDADYMKIEVVSTQKSK